jgi:hypothetical protein
MWLKGFIDYQDVPIVDSPVLHGIAVYLNVKARFRVLEKVSLDIKVVTLFRFQGERTARRDSG